MLDPIVENERLASLPVEDPNFRLMKKKAILFHDSYMREKPDRIELFKKNSCLEFKIGTWQQYSRVNTRRCDHDHFHPVVSEKRLWLETLEIPWDKARQLARWILDQHGDE